MINFFYKENYSFEDLLEIMRILRSEEGCPWDREQTHGSIRANLIEEAYEAAEAIDLGDSALLCEELGDVLLQVVFHSRMSEEAGGFAIGDVTDGVCKKLIVRHPHIFGDIKAETSEEVLSNWEDIKNKTKGHKTPSDAVNAVARSLPALIRAEKVQGRAEKSGLGKSEPKTAEERFEKERERFAVSLSAGTGAEDALGELLFAAAGIARSMGINPERALEKATDRFAGRFAKLEKLAEEKGVSFQGTGSEELDMLWDKLETEERQNA